MKLRRIVVEFPVSVGEELSQTFFDAVCEALDDAAPANRDGWDVDVYSDVIEVASGVQR